MHRSLRAAMILSASCAFTASARAQILCGKVRMLPDSTLVAGVRVGLVSDTGTARRVADSTSTDPSGSFCFRPPRTDKYVPVVWLRSGERLDARPSLLFADSLDVVLLVDSARKRLTDDFGAQTPVRMAQPARMRGYPRDLMAVKARGSVLASFVVGPTGRVVPGSLKILRSDDFRFTQALRDAIGSLLFHPATIGGRKVHSLAQQEFTFTPPP